MSAFIDSQRAAGLVVEIVCRALGVSRSAHYARQSAPPSARAVRDAELVETIRRLHKANFEAYGYRKLHQALRRAGVQDVGRDRVKRLMREHGIQGAKRRGTKWKTTTPDPDAGRIWSSVTSRPAGRMSSTSPTSRICAAGRGWCSWRS